MTARSRTVPPTFDAGMGVGQQTLGTARCIVGPPHALLPAFATTAVPEGIGLPAVPTIQRHDRLRTTSHDLNFTDPPSQEEFERK